MSRYYNKRGFKKQSKSPALTFDKQQDDYFDIYGLKNDADPRSAQNKPLTGSFSAPPPSPTKTKKSVTPNLGSLFLKDTVKESKARLASPSFTEQAAPPKSDSKPFYSSPSGVPNIFKTGPDTSSMKKNSRSQMNQF